MKSYEFFWEKSISDIFQNLKWQESALVSRNFTTCPIHLETSSKSPGIYLTCFKPGAKLQYFQGKKRKIPAAKKIGSVHLTLTNLTHQNILSVGKTTDIHKRIKQHFGTNYRNNRIRKRLEEFVKESDLNLFITENLFIKYTEVNDWLERDLLEAYIKAKYCPVLDISAEH